MGRGVVVLELDSHPDPHTTLRWSMDPSYRILILATPNYNIQQQTTNPAFDCTTLCLEVLTVHGNELRLVRDNNIPIQH